MLRNLIAPYVLALPHTSACLLPPEGEASARATHSITHQTLDDYRGPTSGRLEGDPGDYWRIPSGSLTGLLDDYPLGDTEDYAQDT